MDFKIPEKLNKHDRYVQELCELISPEYDSISTNVIIRNSKRSLAEVDVLAFKAGRYDVYEVKCSMRVIKTKHQMRKIRKHLKVSFGNFYMYCGNNKLLLEVEEDKDL